MTPDDTGLPLRHRYVYPGHALVVAICIMQAYKRCSDALAPTVHGWPACVGSPDVPGAGDGAYAGAELIRRLQLVKQAGSDDTVDNCITWAADGWRHRVGPGSGNHEHAYEPGCRQAVEHEPLFRKMVEEWDWS